jgi:hypothetical protein
VSQRFSSGGSVLLSPECDLCNFGFNSPKNIKFERKSTLSFRSYINGKGIPSPRSPVFEKFRRVINRGAPVVRYGSLLIEHTMSPLLFLLPRLSSL